MSGVMDLHGFQETLRKVQQERDRYRSETARLRTENASLLNEIDVLKVRLSDLEGERTIHEAVDAQRKPCINSKISVKDAVYASSVDGSINSLPSDVASPCARNHEAVDDRSGETIDINEFVRSGHLTDFDEESMAFKSTSGIESATGSYPMTVPPAEWYEGPNAETVSMYSEESPLYPFYRGKKGKGLLTLSAERIARCLENIHHISCDPPCSPVEVSHQFLFEVAFPSPGGAAKLQVPVSPGNRNTMRCLLLGSDYVYFPTKPGSRGLLFSCRKEIMKSSQNWSCFASMRDAKKPKRMMYVGDYRLVHVDELSLEEYNLQPLRAQKKFAEQGVILPNKKIRMQKDKGELKLEQQAALQAMMDALATGQEKVRIIAMEFVGYDLDFAEHVRAMREGLDV